MLSFTIRSMAILFSDVVFPKVRLYVCILRFIDK